MRQNNIAKFLSQCQFVTGTANGKTALSCLGEIPLIKECISSILVTHIQEEAFSYADRIAVMKNGRVLQIGTPKDIYMYPESEDIVLVHLKVRNPKSINDFA